MRAMMRGDSGKQGALGTNHLLAEQHFQTFGYATKAVQLAPTSPVLIDSAVLGKEILFQLRRAKSTSLSTPTHYAEGYG